jgi:hypothetical protein
MPWVFSADGHADDPADQDDLKAKLTALMSSSAYGVNGTQWTAGADPANPEETGPLDTSKPAARPAPKPHSSSSSS